MIDANEAGTIVKASDYTDDAQGWAQRLTVEISHAKEALRPWHEQGEKVVDVFLDRRTEGVAETRINLFTANVQTLRALLYGKVPQVDVKRRFGDPNDKVARCAAETLQRLLNTDIERDSDGYVRALKNALTDRLLPGLGVVRLRYVAEFETIPEKPAITRPDPMTGEEVELAPAVPEQEQKSHEDVEIDHMNWRDFLWSANARTWEEVRWIAFRNPMTRDAGLKRFGDIFQTVPLNSSLNKPTGLRTKADPWSRADVWEVWHKETREVFWYVEGFEKILDRQDDPLGLEGFFPAPMPMFANLTTDFLLPTPDYKIAQDLYREVNILSTRISLLESAIRVAGVYNENCVPFKRLLSEAGFNEMIPASEWKMFAEGGGLKGNVDWFPLDMVVAALEKLVVQRQEKIALLYQVTGMSDIMRGQAGAPATATEQAIKAKFASVRVQDFQDEFARFASDAQKIKGEIICRWYDDDSISKRSNMGFTPDAALLPQAIQLLRDEFAAYRIQVKPESVSLTDYAALKQERVEIMGALSQYLQVVQQVGMGAPQMVPFLLEIMKWAFTGFRGGATIEAVIDQAVIKAQEMAQQAMMAAMQPPPPDPKLEAAKVKGQVDIQKAGMDMQRAQFDHAAKMQEMKAETQKNQIDTALSVRQMEMQMRRDAMQAVTEETRGHQQAEQDQASHEMMMEKISMQAKQKGDRDGA